MVLQAVSIFNIAGVVLGSLGIQYQLYELSLVPFNFMQLAYPREAIKAGIATTIIPMEAVAARREVLTSTYYLLKILIYRLKFICEY